MGLYKVTGPTPVEEVEPGKVLDHDFTADEEATLLAHGRLALEPRSYRNIGPNDFYTIDGKKHEPGETFDAAFPVDQEKAHLEGGALERVEKKQRKAAQTKKES